jgi:hypothetical protein
MADVEFSLFKMFEKVIKSGIQLALAFVGNLGLAQFGITIDPTVATVAIFGALEALRNVLKIKLGLKWL